MTVTSIVPIDTPGLEPSGGEDRESCEDGPTAAGITESCDCLCQPRSAGGSGVGLAQPPVRGDPQSMPAS
jgi:hypothetical protein